MCVQYTHQRCSNLEEHNNMDLQLLVVKHNTIDMRKKMKYRDVIRKRNVVIQENIRNMRKVKQVGRCN